MKYRTLLIVLILISAVIIYIFAFPTSDQTFSAGSGWVQHPGIAVGRLLGPGGEMIAVVGDIAGNLHAFHPSGLELTGFPRHINDSTMAVSQGGITRAYNNAVNSTPALVDIDGDGKLEIFVGSGDGWVYGIKSDGTNLPGWPQFTGVSAGDGNYGVFSSPAVADLAGDGKFEVIVGTFSHFIYVWRAGSPGDTGGAIFPGWPFNNADTVWSSPAVGDFNRDGKLEIVIGGDSSSPPGGVLRMFQYTGEQVSGWPQYIDQIIQSSPAIGDIDGDGQLEIVVGTGIFDFGGPATGEYVNAYRANGTKEPGWPVSLADGIPSTDNRVFGSPALADLDGNGKLETFVGDMNGHLYCINPNGTIRWNGCVEPGCVNSSSYAFFSSPAVGDVDGDGFLDVVIGGGFHLNAFDARTGALKYSIYTGQGVVPLPPVFTFSSPTIADIDGDGKVDVLIGSGRQNNPVTQPPVNIGFVKVYHETGSVGTGTLGPTGVSPSVAPWPRFRRTNRGSGSTNELGASTGGSPLISNATASPFVFSPNGDGINDTVSFQFALSAPDRITLDILDRTGTIVAVPLNGVNLGAGNQTVSWNGTTLSSTLTIDGMYTFRIRGDVAAPVLGSFGVNNTIPEASTTWFLAEGSTVGFAAYVLIQNPNFSPITAILTFFKQDGTTKVDTETVPARTRTTVAIHDPIKGVGPSEFSVSTRVTANLPILVERAMYFNNNQAGTDTAGVTSLSKNWYFAGNRIFSGDEDFILIVNTSTSSSATVTATFVTEGQDPIVQTYTVAPTARFTIAVHGCPPFGPCLPAGSRASVILQSTIPIAAERSFYVGNRAGGSADIGAASPSLTWYFAEGDTSTTFSPTTIPVNTFLDMFNPGDLVATVTVNYMIEDGTVITRTYTIAGKRRLTLDLSNQAGVGKKFSIEVLSNNPIVAERIMGSGTDVGDAIGSPTTALVWNLAEGFTAFGYETWVLISNPGNQTANLTVNFLKQNTQTVQQNYSLPPKQRLTIYVNNVAGIEPTSVSTQVVSDKPVVVERTMRFSNRFGMHQSMGVRQ